MAEANWIKVDVSTLPADVAKKYAALKEANAAARDARATFEAAFLQSVQKSGKAQAKAALQAGKSLAFAYKFGNLAIAFVDATEAKKGKGEVSLF